MNNRWNKTQFNFLYVELAKRYIEVEKEVENVWKEEKPRPGMWERTGVCKFSFIVEKCKRNLFLLGDK